MRAATALLLLTLTACGGSGDSDTGDNYLDNPPLWNEYTIGYLKTINLAEGVSLEFTAVEEDTRCPTNVQCVAQGNARIVITTFTPRGQQIVRLNTDNQLPISALFDFYGVELRNLDPKPEVNPQNGSSTISPSAYEARVFVIKAAAVPPPGPT